MAGRVVGGDLRWTTPLKGLTAGASILSEDITIQGVIVKPSVDKTNTLPTNSPYRTDTKTDKIYTYYGSYALGNLRIDGEYRRNWKVLIAAPGSPIPGGNPADVRSWYTSAAYRICKYLELGTYHSRFYSNWKLLHSANNNHIFDQAVTARIDLTRYWNLKVERHFMDGYGLSGTFRGFYAGLNPQGLQPKTNTFIVRTGWNF
jgi:hypothetical protein